MNLLPLLYFMDIIIIFLYLKIMHQLMLKMLFLLIVNCGAFCPLPPRLSPLLAFRVFSLALTVLACLTSSR